MGRPKKELDEKLVEELAAIFCTKEEIASVLNCSVETLNERCAEAMKRGRDKGKASLRRKQWESIENGNITMLVWFGKQFLGQTEKMENALNDEQYNELLSAAHSAMVHLSGAGKPASGHSTIQA